MCTYVQKNSHILGLPYTTLRESTEVRHATQLTAEKDNGETVKINILLETVFV